MKDVLATPTITATTGKRGACNENADPPATAGRRQARGDRPYCARRFVEDFGTLGGLCQPGRAHYVMANRSRDPSAGIQPPMRVVEEILVDEGEAVQAGIC